MQWSARQGELGTVLAIAALGLVFVSPAVADARSADGHQRDTARDHTTTGETAAPSGDAGDLCMPPALGIGRDLVILAVPATRLTAAMGAAAALAMAIHYDDQRPYPTACRPRPPDKWQHCFVGCRIATLCPFGTFSASVLALLKEIRDVMDGGAFSIPDMFATLEGAWSSTCCDTCEVRCCKRWGDAHGYGSE